MANGPGAGQGGTIAAVPRNPAEAAAMEFIGAGFGQGQMMPGSPIDEPDYVWMGTDYETTPKTFSSADLYTPAHQRIGAGWMTVEKADAEWYVMDARKKQQVTDYVAAIDDKIPTDERTRYKYVEAIRQAQQFTAVYPDNPLTPFEVLRRNAENAVQVRAMRGGSGGGTSRVVNLTNPDDAKSLVNASLQKYLGRDATDEEITEFTKALNKAERRNPIVTTKTQKSGGVGSAQRAEDFARSQEGAAEFLAETQYSDWFQEAIMASPTEGIASGL